MKNFLIIYFSVVILITIQPVCAISQSNFTFITLLSKRQQLWPDWNRTLPLNQTSLKVDVIYPEWFKGYWGVDSYETVNSNNNISHIAHFKVDSKGRVVADRAFNTQSLGKQSLGKDLIKVIDDPNNPNRQLSQLNRNRYLETKVISRKFELNNMDEFFSDEVYFQILYSPDLSKVSQVEILSKYYLCEKGFRFIDNELPNESICGEQWQVNFPLDGKIRLTNSPNAYHYNLILTPLKSKESRDLFLIDLANEKEIPIVDDY